MNPRIAKEIRVQLLPFGLVACIAILPVWVLPQQSVTLMLPLFALAASMMAASAFGQEFHHRTLSTLLAQPLSRLVIWREKTLVMGGFLLLGTVLIWRALAYDHQERFWEDRELISWSIPLISLCAFCGAPFWTLLLRSNLVGMILSLLAPLGLLMIFSILCERIPHEPRFEFLGGTVLSLVYCGACFVAGWRRFRTMEALDGAPAGRAIGIPFWVESLLSKPVQIVFGTVTGPFLALVRKELRLQQVTFLGAALFTLLALAAIVLKRGRFDFGEGHGFFDIVLILDFTIYLIFVPLIAGAGALVEEKLWGVTDWHFTLPSSVASQWLIKMVIVHGTTIVLGLLLPALVAFLAGAIPTTEASREQSPLLFVLCAYLLLVSVSIYAASLSTNNVRSIFLTVVILLGLGSIFRLAIWAGLEYQGPSGHFILLLSEDADSQREILESMALIGGTSLLFPLQLLAFRAFRQRTLRPGQLAVHALVLSFFVFTVGLMLGLFTWH